MLKKKTLLGVIQSMNYKLDTDKEVFFYEQEFYVLSNFSAFNLEYDNQIFPTSEHAYHYMKFSNENDVFMISDTTLISVRHLMREKILNAKSAHDAFKLGQENKAARRTDWEDVKFKIMKDILRHKVIQHPYVMKKLIDSGNRELIEDSWRDAEWGWGPNKDGQNMLGKIWMELRDELTKNIKTKGETNVI